MDVQIPDKLYFKIGEVARLTGVKTHVLRYWESEFGSIRPNKSRSKQRLYRKQDIELILHLKDLLYNQGFTIAGARKQLRRKPNDLPTTEPSNINPHVSDEPPDDQLTLQFSRTLDLKLLREIKEDVLRLIRSLD
ncbi:MAG: MerR family transcriptional regulator [Deltaproteobacteria bacterium]|jgi:DNA-binding transcriptional MerR regulator|nr:MerR family transcriptional regulator [Deltaproteobacteria bacterium]MBW2476814.1 MerR family transcriptional regulator [Deltaproteobacteria bacterium]MBW2503025.1 MerR family transcriptional regulator [Deltaproteobacteria bacterium]MBW2518744.1 MerR family transcriptional regulator [Deltaproteobacteria bacterium]